MLPVFEKRIDKTIWIYLLLVPSLHSRIVVVVVEYISAATIDISLCKNIC